MPDVAALVSQMSETLAQIHETIAGLDTATHDSKLDALEQECDSAIQALQESFELESADLDRKRKSAREEIAEQRRKEDEEREARRRREDEELAQSEQTEDEQRQVKLDEQTEGIEEQTDAKMEEAEEEERKRLEEGERRLVDLEERRKEINRLIEEQMRVPLPPLPARRRARTSVSRGAVAAASRSAPSEAKGKPEAPAAEEKPAPALVDKSVPVVDEKPAPAADEKPSAVPDEKPTAVADEKPAAATVGKSISAADEKSVAAADEKATPEPTDKSIPVADEKPTPAADGKSTAIADEKLVVAPTDKSTPAADGKPVVVADEKLAPATEESPVVADENSTPAPVDKPIPVVDEKPTPAIEEKLPPVANQIPTPVTGEKGEEKAALIENQPIPAPALAAEEKPAPVPEEKQETSGSKDIKAHDTDATEEAPIDAPVSAAKADEHSVPPSVLEPLPEDKAAADKSDAPMEAHVVEAPKEDMTAKSETTPADEHISEDKVDIAPKATPAVDTSEEVADEAPQATKVITKQNAETPRPVVERQGGGDLAIASVKKDDNESEEPNAAPLANGAVAPETLVVQARGIPSDMTAKASTETEILEEAPAPSSPLGSLDLKVKSLASDKSPADSQAEPPVRKEADAIAEQASVTQTSKPLASPNAQIEVPVPAAVDDGSVHAEEAEMPTVQKPEQDLPSEIKPVSKYMVEAIRETDSKAVAPTTPPLQEAMQPGSVEPEHDDHLEHQIELQREVTRPEEPLVLQESAVKAQEAEPKVEARSADIPSVHALDREESVLPDGTQGLDSVLESDSEYEKIGATAHDAAGSVVAAASGIAETKQLDQPAPAERLAGDVLPQQPEHDNLSEPKLSTTEAAIDSENHDEDSSEPELLSDSGEFDLHHPGFSPRELSGDPHNLAETPNRQIAPQITGADDKTLSTEPADREAVAVIHKAEELEGDKLSKPAVEAVTDSMSGTAAAHERPTELDHGDMEEAAQPEERSEAPEKESNAQAEHAPVSDAPLALGNSDQDNENAVRQEISHESSAKLDVGIQEVADVAHATEAPKPDHGDDHTIQVGDEESAPLETAPVAPASAPSVDLDVEPSAAPDAAKVADVAETKAPVKAEEPNKAQEAVEGKDMIKSEEITKAEEHVKAEDTIKAEEPVNVEEPIKVEGSTKAGEATETDAAAKIGDALDVKAAEPNDAAAATHDEASKVQDVPQETDGQLPFAANKMGMDIAESSQVADGHLDNNTLTQNELSHESNIVIADNAHPMTPLETSRSAAKAHSLQIDDGLGHGGHGPADLVVSDMQSQLQQIQDAESQVLVAGNPTVSAPVIDYDDSHSEVSGTGSAFDLDHKLPAVPLASHTGEPVSPLDASEFSSLAHNTDLPHEDLPVSDTDDEAPQHAPSLHATLDAHSIIGGNKLDAAKPSLGAASRATPAIEAPVSQQEAAEGQASHTIPASTSFDQYESAHEAQQDHDDSDWDSEEDHHGAASLAPLNKSTAADVRQKSVVVPHLGLGVDTVVLSDATNPQLYATPLQQEGDLHAHAQYPQASAIEEKTATVYGTDDLFEDDSEVSDQSSRGAKAQELEHQAAAASSGQEHVGHHDNSTALESGDAHEPASPARVHVEMAPEAKLQETEEMAPADSRPELTVMTEQRPVSQEFMRNIEEDLRTPRALPDATSEQPGAAPMSTPHLAPAAAMGHSEDISPLLLRNQSPVVPFKGLAASRHAPRPDSLQFTPMKFPAEAVTEQESPSWEKSQEHSDLEAEERYGQQSQGWEQNSPEQYPPATPRAQMQEPHAAQQDSPDAVRGRLSLASELEQASGNTSYGSSYGHEDDEMEPEMFAPRDVTNMSWHARTDSVPASLHSRTTLSSAPSSPIHAALQQDNHEPVIRDSWATVPQNQHESLAGLGGDYSNRPRGYTQSIDYGRARGVSEVSQYDPFRYDAGGPGEPKSGGMVQNIAPNDASSWQPQEPAPQQTRESPPQTLASKRESMAATASPGSLFQRMRNVFEKPQDGGNAEADVKGVGSPARSRPVSGVFYPVKPTTPRSNRNSMVYDGTAQASTQGALGGSKYDNQTPGGAQKGWRQEDEGEHEGVDEKSSLLSGSGVSRVGAH
ncbi:hypothetical protein GGTG_03138 [Gaeumannomyces tritici R3-111a-1]|uniref:Uncharacterized protein n=1 Tax=Gaeumannomyces tritici (strain R3-111a-1) TaxID=644352 RepID=J3NPD0_GAET3|nr:hypothetical protein GGTG_03138 [Gaeumannomyces tritici R3-111a-1]EJT78035.1 hypothetical protein GGTG_03138 [Gaeumannomyces tritici R3-111a-1]